jgi:uncharacterized protein (DUF1501 family)
MLSGPHKHCKHLTIYSACWLLSTAPNTTIFFALNPAMPNLHRLYKSREANLCVARKFGHDAS